MEPTKQQIQQDQIDNFNKTDVRTKEWRDQNTSTHSFVADKMSKVPTEVTDAIRNDTEVPDSKLKALSNFSKLMVSKRGLPSVEDVDTFLNAGYTQDHILGVITGIGVKTMSNYFNHVFNTTVDSAFSSRVWAK